MQPLFSIILVIFAYLLGSVSSAITVSKCFDLPDPCTHGSKNPGASNVLRLAGKKYAAIVLCFDMFKGFLPVCIAQYFGASDYLAAQVVLAAVLGHMFPIFFGFIGGKGVATALGGLFALNAILGLATVGVWVIVARFTRYSSLASITALIAAPFISSLLHQSLQVYGVLMLMNLFIIYQHRNNITRLCDHAEPKIKFSNNKQ